MSPFPFFLIEKSIRNMRLALSNFHNQIYTTKERHQKSRKNQKELILKSFTEATGGNRQYCLSPFEQHRQEDCQVPGK